MSIYDHSDALNHRELDKHIHDHQDDCSCHLDGGLMPGEHDLRCRNFTYERCSRCGGRGIRTLSSGDIGDCWYCDGSGIESET